MSPFFSVCDGVSLLVCFRSSTVLSLFALISYFIGHASYSVFTQFANLTTVEHFFLDPSQLLSSVYLRNYFRHRLLSWVISVPGDVLRRMLSWVMSLRCAHSGVPTTSAIPRADFTTGLGPVGVFPAMHKGSHLPSVHSSPFVLDYALLYVFMRSGRNPLPDRRCRSRHHPLLRLQGLLSFGTSYMFWARRTCFPAVNRVSSRSLQA